MYYNAFYNIIHVVNIHDPLSCFSHIGKHLTTVATRGYSFLLIVLIIVEFTKMEMRFR